MRHTYVFGVAQTLAVIVELGTVQRAVGPRAVEVPDVVEMVDL